MSLSNAGMKRFGFLPVLPSSHISEKTQRGNNVKRTILALAVVLSLMSFGLSAAFGADRVPQSAATFTSGVVHAMPNTPAGLKTIFTNLGSKTDAYDASNGYFVSGLQNTDNGQQQDLALPFTPKKNSTVTEVELALQWYSYGYNGATVEIAADASGLPGKVLSKQDLKNFGTFGSGCCKLAVWKLKKGVKVKKGTQYWVVGTTDKKSVTSVNTWDYVYNDAAGTFAFQQDSGGWILLNQSSGYAPPAGAVLGTTP
jgi:hypothetical protein